MCSSLSTDLEVFRWLYLDSQSHFSTTLTADSSHTAGLFVSPDRIIPNKKREERCSVFEQNKGGQLTSGIQRPHSQFTCCTRVFLMSAESDGAN